MLFAHQKNSISEFENDTHLCYIPLDANRQIWFLLCDLNNEVSELQETARQRDISMVLLVWKLGDDARYLFKPL